MGVFYRHGVPTGDNGKLMEMVGGKNMYLIPFIYMLKPDYSSKFYVIFYHSGKKNGGGGGRERERDLKGKGSECLESKLSLSPPTHTPH